MVFKAIQTLYEDSKVVDVITVSDYLDSVTKFKPNPSFEHLSSIVETTAGYSNIIAYANNIREKALLRELKNISEDIINDTHNPGGRTASELVDLAESKIFEIAERGNRNMIFSEMNDLIKKAYSDLDERYRRKDKITGVSTGFRAFDNLTAGLQNGDLIIIAGRPSMGKTALALNIAEHNAISEEKPVAIFSMEMSATSLTQRMMSSLGSVNSLSIKTGDLKEKDWSRVQHAIDLMKKAPIYIDDTPTLTPIDLRARARRLQREKGLSLIVIDYLQLMTVYGQKENRATEISEISRSLKALARELDIPIVALSQLNRSVELRTDRQPRMSDLRESGAIEQDADLIAFIYREEAYPDIYDPESGRAGEAQINIAKQRNGSTGQFFLKFVGKHTRFEEADYETTFSL